MNVQRKIATHHGMTDLCTRWTIATITTNEEGTMSMSESAPFMSLVDAQDALDRS